MFQLIKDEFVLFYSLRPSQQFFSHVGAGLPVFNQYYARINVSCLRTQHNDAGEALKRVGFHSA